MEHGGEASPGREGGSCRVRVRPVDTVLGRGLMTSLRPAGQAVRAVSAFARHMTMALGMEHMVCSLRPAERAVRAVSAFARQTLPWEWSMVCSIRPADDGAGSASKNTE